MQRFLLALALSGALLGHGSLVAQAASLDEKDVKALAERLADLRKAQSEASRVRGGQKNLEKAEADFKSEVERLNKAHGDAALLGMEDSWRQVFHQSLLPEKERNPSGEGRISERTVTWGSAGEELAVKYSIYLPKGYSRGESWPVIICLHDSADSADGDKLIKELWLKADARDQFVIVAPTLGKKTVGRNDKVQVRIDRRDINDLPHLNSIFRTLNDVLQNFRVDAERVYLDGVGQGATTAVDLAIARPKHFAGVAARTGAPMQIKFLGNVAGLLPILFIDREDGVFSKGDGATWRQQLETLAKEVSASIEFKLYPPVTDRALQRQALGSAGVDQIPEATADVAAFFGEKRRELSPKTLRFGTWNSRFFKRSGWVVLDRAEGEPRAGTESSFVGTIKDGNVVEITTNNVERFSIYTSAKLFDLSKPIRVVVNGKTVREEVVPPSMDYMLNYFSRNVPDGGHIVHGVISVEVPAAEAATTPGGAAGAGAGDSGGGR